MNEKAGIVEVELGGKTRPMRFGWNEVAALEEHLGMGISSIMNERNTGFRTVRGIYWAGLKWKDRGLTVERVGNMLDEEMENGKTIKDLFKPALRALKASRIFKKQADSDEVEDDEENEDQEKN